MRRTLTVPAIIVFGIFIGCGQPGEPTGDDSNPDAAAQDGAVPEGQVQEGAVHGGEVEVQEPSPAGNYPPAATAGAGLAGQAFAAANQRAIDIMMDLMKTLDGVTDEASARTAAPRLAALTSSWKSAATAGTAAYLVLDGEEREQIFKDAVFAQHGQLASLGLRNKPDLVQQIQRVAKVGGPAIEQELIGLRDAILTTRGIYSPVTMRERTAKKLGAEGSPLMTD